MMTRNVFSTLAAVLLTLTLAFAVNSASAANLEGYWTFDNAGNLGEDTSVNANQLNSSGTPSPFALGKFNGALDLNGPGPNDVLTQGGPFPTGIPTGGASYTVTAWVNANPGNGSGGFVGWGNYGTNSQVNASRAAGSGAYNHYWWSNDLGAGGLPNQETGAPPAGWHHFVATYDAGTQNQFVYVDGAVANSRNVAPPNVQPLNFTVGKTVNTEYWNGQLDDVAIFSGTPLTASDVTALYNGGLGQSVGDFLGLNAPAVPEPSTFVMAVFALAAFGLLGWRRRQR